MKNSVLVKFFNFDEYTGDSRFVLNREYDQGTTIVNILVDTGIPQKAVGFVTVNGKLVTWDYILHNNDHVNVYPLMDGG